MRIIVTTHYSARVGGVETYVERLLALLVEAGHEVAAVFDLDRSTNGPNVTVPAGVATLFVESEGRDAVIRAINAMDGAVVFANSIESTLVQGERAIRHPIAFYTHTFVASCINGMRLNRKPVPAPCEKVFGPACLLHYFPRRCGGLSPLTMIASYRRQYEDRRFLSHVDLVVANSDAVARQFEHVGIDAKILHPAIVDQPGTPRTGFRDDTRRALTFVGRFEDYKGGSQLLKALPHVATALEVPVRLTMVGDGRERDAWEREAEGISRRNSAVTVRFTGWLSANGVSGALEQSDLLVVPSVWPEPFGLVGFEAARFGVPSAAFAVGGIPEWLTDGVNGHLADGRSCEPRDLGAAIVRGLTDVDAYRRLSNGAVEKRTTFTPEAHLRRLEELFQLAIESRTAKTD